MPRSSLSMLLHRDSALVSLLLANDVDCSAALSGASFHGSHMPSLVCSRLAPRPKFDTSICRFSYSFGSFLLVLVCVVPWPFTFQ